MHYENCKEIHGTCVSGSPQCRTVSYTHLDVYKRQVIRNKEEAEAFVPPKGKKISIVSQLSLIHISWNGLSGVTHMKIIKKITSVFMTFLVMAALVIGSTSVVFAADKVDDTVKSTLVTLSLIHI